MRTTRLLSAAIGTALAVGISGNVMAADDKSEVISTQKDVPMIVLMPVAIATTADFSDGCWARLYDSTDFKGDQLALVGPIDMPDMRTAFGTDWSGDFDSIRTGPKAKLTVYDAENYKDRAASFEPGKDVRDLDEKMGTFEQVRSVKIACSGDAKTAQVGRDGSASRKSDTVASFSALDTNNDGMLGRIEAAADADAESRFDRRDANNDQKLSRSEYEA